MTRMPPQAYTKEVLATAFDWLSRQPENIKKSIRTSDDLVGLFLKATRGKEPAVTSNQGAYSNSSNQTDLSSAKSFRSELQGLALNLKQFEDKPEISEPMVSDPPQVSDYLHELNLMMSTQPNAQTSLPNSNSNSLGQTNHQSHGQQNHQSMQGHSQSNLNSNLQANIHSQNTLGSAIMMNSHTPPSKEIIPESADTVLFKLDKKTVSAINLAKERLNLSSNTEAIRVLVSLGEKHLKKIFGTEE